MYLAIDIGSGLTKVIHENGQFMFPSAGAVCANDKVFDDGVKPHEVIYWKDKRYVVGQYAYSMLKPEEREFGFSKTYYQRNIQKIYLFSAIAKIYPEGFEGSLALVTGLPVSVFADGQQIYTEALVGTHSFNNKDGAQYKVTFHKEATKVVPQATGLHFANLADAPRAGHDKVRVGYLDPGTYTFGYSCIEENRYIHRDSGGFEVGLEKLANAMLPLLKDLHGWEPRHIEDVLRALRLGKVEMFDHHGQSRIIDMVAVAEVAVPKVYGEAFEQIAKTWDVQNMRVFISSGGGEYLFKTAQRYFPQIKLMHPNKKKGTHFNEDAIMDVCVGYAAFCKNLAKHLPTDAIENIVNLKQG